MTPRVRTFSPRDKPFVINILKSLAAFEPHEVVVAEEVIDAYLHDPASSGYHILVIELKNNVLGYVCYGPTPLTSGTWDIYWIAVSPESKGQGMGRLLIRNAEDNIRKAEGRLIIVETSSKPIYEEARRFYERHQYKLICQIPDFYSVGDDKVMYGKSLVA